MSKKKYIKPAVEIENYVLNMKVATGCGEGIINLGPGDEYHDPCSDALFPTGTGNRTIGDTSWEEGDHVRPVKTNFYPESCDCYLTSGDGIVFTS